MASGPRTGYEDLVRCLRALPGRYSDLVNEYLVQARRDYGDEMRRFGPRVESVLRAVLDFEGLKPIRPGPLYEEQEFVRPDVFVAPRAFVEVTKWSDTNKLASMLAQGILVKRKEPDALYFAVIAGLGAKNTWSDAESVDFYLGGESQIGGVKVVDGYYGFKNVGHLVERLRREQ